jgi:hypothetical protein
MALALDSPVPDAIIDDIVHRAALRDARLIVLNPD